MANQTNGGSKKKPGRPKRWSAERKAEVVLRLLRGESLDAVSRETGLPAATLSEWRDAFIETGKAGLKTRTKDPVQQAAADRERQLLAKIGELSMDVEILKTAKEVLEERTGPSWPRKSKK